MPWRLIVRRRYFAEGLTGLVPGLKGVDAFRIDVNDMACCLCAKGWNVNARPSPRRRLIFTNGFNKIPNVAQGEALQRFALPRNEPSWTMFAIFVFLAGLYLSLTAARPHTSASTADLVPGAVHTLTPRVLLPTAPAPPLPPSTTSPTVTNQYIIPTSYLTQVPPKWPYTAYGVGEKETATWGLTDGEGKTVALVKHSVLRYPQPKEGERDVLEGWRRTFAVPRETGV